MSGEEKVDVVLSGETGATALSVGCKNLGDDDDYAEKGCEVLSDGTGAATVWKGQEMLMMMVRRPVRHWVVGHVLLLC